VRQPAFGTRQRQVPLQLGCVVHAPRQHGEDALDRLGKGREAQVRWQRLGRAHRHVLKRQAGRRRDLLQHAPRVQLVLRGHDALRAGPRQAEPLGHHGRRERAEVLVVRQHRAPAGAPAAGGQPVGKGLQVEARQRQIAGEGEQVEAGTHEAHGTGGTQACERAQVPVVGKQPGGGGNGGVQGNWRGG